MAKKTLTRALSSVHVSGRTIVGLACPFDTPTQISDGRSSYTERFQQGAFARTIAERGSKIKVMVLHDRKKLPIGKATSLVEREDGLYVELAISETQQGDDVLALVRDGALDGLSISFVPVIDRWSKDRQSVTRVEVKLIEISVVTEPAYDSARVLALRSAPSPHLSVDIAERRLALLTQGFTNGQI